MIVHTNYLSNYNSIYLGIIRRRPDTYLLIQCTNILIFFETFDFTYTAFYYEYVSKYLLLNIEKYNTKKEGNLGDTPAIAFFGQLQHFPNFI